MQFKHLPQDFRLPSIMNYSVEWINTMMARQALDLDIYIEEIDCNLQRDLVWEEADNEDFIQSLKHQCVFSPIIACLASKSEYKYNILDGKQRINAIMQGYKSGELTKQMSLTIPICILPLDCYNNKQLAELFLFVNKKPKNQNQSHIKILTNFVNG